MLISLFHTSPVTPFFKGLTDLRKKNPGVAPGFKDLD